MIFKRNHQIISKKELSWIKVINKLEDIELKIDYAKQTRHKEGEGLFKRSIEQLEAEKSNVMKNIDESCAKSLELDLNQLNNALTLLNSYTENTNQLLKSNHAVVLNMLENKLLILERLTNLVIKHKTELLLKSKPGDDSLTAGLSM